MNLREFINYRKLCPFCNKPNKICFHSPRKQLTSIRDHTMLTLFSLKEITKKSKLSDHRAGFSIDLDTHRWNVGLYNGNTLSNTISLTSLNKFKDLINNFNRSGFEFSLCCKQPTCASYMYTSTDFLLDIKNPIISSFSLKKECISFRDASNIYICNNVMFHETSSLHKPYTIVNVASSHTNYRYLENKLPFIPFKDKDHYISRIKKMLTFI